MTAARASLRVKTVLSCPNATFVAAEVAEKPLPPLDRTPRTAPNCCAPTSSPRICSRLYDGSEASARFMFVAGPVTCRRIAVGGSETNVVATASTSGITPLGRLKLHAAALQVEVAIEVQASRPWSENFRRASARQRSRQRDVSGRSDVDVLALHAHVGSRGDPHRVESDAGRRLAWPPAPGSRTC